MKANEQNILSPRIREKSALWKDLLHFLRVRRYKYVVNPNYKPRIIGVKINRPRPFVKTISGDLE